MLCIPRYQPGVAVLREGAARRVPLPSVHAGAFGALDTEAFVEELSLWVQWHQGKDLSTVIMHPHL